MDTDEPFVIKFTQACLDRILKLKKLKNTEEDLSLRIFVDSGGCSGFQYNFEIVETQKDLKPKDDYVFKTK